MNTPARPRTGSLQPTKALGLLAGLLVGLSGPVCAQSGPSHDPSERSEITSQASLEADLDRLVRRLYLATPAPERAALLTSLLQDPSDAVVRIALELALREQTGGRPLGDSIAEAVVAQIEHPSPRIRFSAVALADLLASDGARDAITGRLASESDPMVADALLRASSRWPDRLDPPAVIRWIRPAEPMSSGLAVALSELAATGALGPGPWRQDVRQSLRRVPDAEVTVPMARLMVELGDDIRLARLLAGDDANARRRAAVALAESRAHAPDVLAAARRHPGLAEAAVIASDHLPTQEATNALLTLPPGEPPDPIDAQLAALAARLPVASLVSMQRSSPSPRRTIALLTTVRARDVASRDRAMGLVLLAEALRDDGQPDRAQRVAREATALNLLDAPWSQRAIAVIGED